MRCLALVAVIAIVAGCRGSQEPEKPKKPVPPRAAARRPIPPELAEQLKRPLPVPPGDEDLFVPGPPHVFRPGETRHLVGLGGAKVTRVVGQHPYLTGAAEQLRLGNLVRHSHRRQQTQKVGGFTSAAGAWPSNVAFIDANNAQYCGGTLIAPDWILTAAHCLPDSRDTFMIGGTSLVTKDGEFVEMAYSCLHPRFDCWKLDSDVALVRLREPAAAAPSAFTQDASSEAPGTPATTVGWGRTSEDAVKGSETLQELDLPIANDSECQTSYAQFLSSSMLCAGEGELLRGSCIGDSGGPLFVDAASGTLQVGVTSWGNACAKEPYGVYTRLSEYAEWINTTMTAETPECLPVLDCPFAR